MQGPGASGQDGIVQVRRRVRQRRTTRVAVVLLVGAIGLAGCGTTAVVRSLRSPTVSVTLHLDRTTTRPGRIDPGQVVITNHSGHVLHIRDCVNRRGLVAGLTSAGVPYEVRPPLRGCHLIRPIGPGRTSLPTWVATTYQNCGELGYPACTGIGLSDLPAGKYVVRFPLAGLPPETVTKLPTVTVLPPAWLTALHGAQGSLLVAASPCMGFMITANSRLPSVMAVVIRGGRVFGRASAIGGGLFTFALPPGRYVVTTTAHMRMVVHLKTGRQTIANLNPGCM
jgi:hypothetical protein